MVAGLVFIISFLNNILFNLINKKYNFITFIFIILFVCISIFNKTTQLSYSGNYLFAIFIALITLSFYMFSVFCFTKNIYFFAKKIL